MTYTVNILSKAQKYLDALDEREVLNIWSSIAELKKNPYRPRPLVDIIKLRGFNLTLLDSANTISILSTCNKF